ncbi:MAG: hypothetical protein JO332_09475 [Planctomycetaceae bacterium]|nr:hypothetical protein [Planctomycetaceae bacterium]
MARRWILMGVALTAMMVFLLLHGFRSGRVAVDPAPRAARKVSETRSSSHGPAIPKSPKAPLAAPTASAAVEVLGATVPHATARAVNSWFDFESALSDLSAGREDLGEDAYRQELLRLTAEFLELAPDRVAALDATLRVVQAELRRIEQEMGKILAAYPVDLSDGELQRVQSAAEDRCRPRRAAALARFETFLDSRDRHREFRAYLDSWVTRCCGLEP